MGNGEWRMRNGKCRVGNVEWGVECGYEEWGMENGKLKTGDRFFLH